MIRRHLTFYDKVAHVFIRHNGRRKKKQLEINRSGSRGGGERGCLSLQRDEEIKAHRKNRVPVETTCARFWTRQPRPHRCPGSARGVTVPRGCVCRRGKGRARARHDGDPGAAVARQPAPALHPTPRSRPTAERVTAFTRQQQPSESIKAPTPFPAEGRRLYHLKRTL